MWGVAFVKAQKCEQFGEKQVNLRWVWLGEGGNGAFGWPSGALNAKLRHVDFVLGWESLEFVGGGETSQVGLKGGGKRG